MSLNRSIEKDAGVTITCPLLDNWRLIQGHLTGTVSGDPDHADGETIHRPMMVIGVVKHRRVCTRNREYQLGTPDPAWVRLLALMHSSPDAAPETVALHNSIQARAARRS
jgi:hypothetical protein